MHRVAEGEGLHPARVRLLEGDQLPVRAPPAPVVAAHLLLGDELGEAVRDPLGATGGEPPLLAAREIEEVQVAALHVADQLPVGRQLRVESPRGRERLHRLLHRPSAEEPGDVHPVQPTREGDDHGPAVVRELVADHSPGSHPLPLELRSLRRAELLRGTLEQRLGREQLSRLPRIDVEDVERLHRRVRRRAEEEHVRPAPFHLQGAGRAVLELPRLGELAKDGVGRWSGGGRGEHEKGGGENHGPLDP
jgi:hypothetical protein